MLSLRDEKYILRAEALIELAFMGLKAGAQLCSPFRARIDIVRSGYRKWLTYTVGRSS